ncbi:hypothetical protein AcW1_000885 [Taiwanofungus camphoratus]|nr:hypothetical protein AcW2_000613 [Antrodia cinnamomea]KAI0963942.1 hypothetical protein AcW1_000885 [Antrodia cinnamomea]
MDISSLRADIKAWERNFRAKHARDPSIQEIKDQPAIAAKYKLYKSLSKAAAAQAPIPHLSTAPPSTPPRSQPRQSTHPSALLSKPRAIKVDHPNYSSNPFSPVAKTKSKPNQLLNLSPRASAVQLPPRQNPFTTPTKPKAPALRKPSTPWRDLSPDPFPLIQPAQPSASALPAPAQSAVTRARKRLRGEPVSPSPVKEKRVRATLAFAGTLASSDDDDDGADMDGDETFLADSPVKPPSGGKTFRLLFDEVLPQPPMRTQSTAQRPPARSRSKSIIAKPTLFGPRAQSTSRAVSPLSSGEDDWDSAPKRKLKGLIASTSTALPNHTQLPRKILNGKNTLPRAVLPGKDDLWADAGPSRSNAKPPQPTANEVQISAASHGIKRPLSHEADAHDNADGLANNGNTFLRLPLLPPSPPPPDAPKPSGTGSKYVEKGKGKGKAAAAFSRKKARLLEQVGGAEESTEEDGDEEKLRVKEVTHPLHAPRPLRPTALDMGIDGEGEGRAEDPDSDWDWQRPPHLRSLSPPAHPDTDADIAAGTLEVRLPDELRRILALSPARESAKEAERLARGLIYGRREGHYDGSRGGEIWDVGEESSGEGGEDDGAEEWEGEGVPWEVGEL